MFFIVMFNVFKTKAIYTILIFETLSGKLWANMRFLIMIIFIKTLRILLQSLLLVLFLLIGYFFIAVFYSSQTIHPAFAECQKDGVEIYLLSNGVHTDVVVPLRNDQKDWSAFVSPGHTRSGSPDARFVAFGWGDKGFYLQTKTWADLKFSTALKALFFLSSTAMHVTYYYQPKESERCKKVCISPAQYRLLVKFIENSFQKTESGESIRIGNSAYFHNDAFYEGKGTYSLFYTCNTWANEAIKSSGMKACLWTPFDKGIFYQYNE